MPDWLSSAPLWAEAAALEGFRAWFARIAPGGRAA
jgi:hypothetical protein